MKHAIFRYLICVMLFAPLGLAHAARLQCELATQELGVVNAEVDGLASRLAALNSWVQGIPDTAYPIDDLFPVDPLDDRALAIFRNEVPDPAGETSPAYGCEKIDRQLQSLHEERLFLTRQIRTLTLRFAALPQTQRRVLILVMRRRQSYAVALHQVSESFRGRPDYDVLMAPLNDQQAALDTRLAPLPKVVRVVLSDAPLAVRTEMLAMWRRHLDGSGLGDIILTDPVVPLTEAQARAWHDYRQAAFRLNDILNDELLRLRSAIIEDTSLSDLPFLLGGLEGTRHALAYEWRAAGDELLRVWYWLATELPAESNDGRRYRALLGDVSWLLLVVALFLVAVKATRLVNQALVRLHDRILQRAGQRRSLVALSRILSTLAPILPWALLWFAVDVLYNQLDRAEHPLLVWLVQPARLYIIYRLMTELAEWLVLRVALGAGNYLGGDRYREASERARRQSFIAVAPWLLVYVAMTLIGHSVIALLLELAAWFVLLMALCQLLKPHLKELIDDARPLLPERWDPQLDRLPERHGSAAAVIPLLPVALAGFVLEDMDRLLSDFDWYRSANARLFRIRSASAEPSAPAADIGSEAKSERYESWFLDPGRLGGKFPFIDTGLHDALRKPLDSWLKDHEEYNTLLLRGERGIGKTTVLDRLQRNLEKEVADSKEGDALQIKRINIPRGCTDTDQIRGLLEAELGTDLSEGPQALAHTDESRQPTLVIIDDAQNLFRASVGGLDGWRFFLSLTNVRVKNLFWLVSINNQSFAYLSNVFGGEYQFATTVVGRRWSQNDIRSLILSRNHQGNMRITYDEVLLSSRGPEAGNLRNAEQRYFGLLWDACRGNPLVALHLWLDCASPGHGQVKAGPPSEAGGHGIEKLGSDLQFVYAAIVVHEALTTADITRTTSLPESVVRYALKAGLDAGFLERQTPGFYTIRASAYQAVINHLARKNMLHE